MALEEHRLAPHFDEEISNKRVKCLKRYFSNSKERRIVNTEFAKFFAALEAFSNHDSLQTEDLWILNIGGFFMGLLL